MKSFEYTKTVYVIDLTAHIYFGSIMYTLRDVFPSPNYIHNSLYVFSILHFLEIPIIQKNDFAFSHLIPYFIYIYLNVSIPYMTFRGKKVKEEAARQVGKHHILYHKDKIVYLVYYLLSCVNLFNVV